MAIGVLRFRAELPGIFMMEPGRSAVLERARAALRGEHPAAEFRVLARPDQAPPVAFLVTFKRKGGDLVLPLVEGVNRVGRGLQTSSSPYGVWPKPYAVEQSQWLIDCAADEARVRDAASTNLSVLVPRAIVPNLDHDEFGFLALDSLPGAILLPHFNTPVEQHWHTLHEGDLLRSVYASFVFGWRDVKAK